MKKVVIAGASVYGLNNLSDDSMLKVLCDELHHCIPDLEITLLARHPNKEFDKEFGVRSIHNLDHQTREESRGRWFNGLNRGDPTDNLREIFTAIQEADLLIMGGDPFIDITIGFYKGITPYTVLLFTLAKFVGTKTMINGVHMCRPLVSAIGIEQAKFCVQNAELVTVREDLSLDLFKEMGFGDLDNVISLADAGYALDPIVGKDKGLEVLRREGIDIGDKKLMGVTFRHMYWRWKPDEWDRYAMMVAKVCDEMHERYGFDMLFIPHNTYEIDTKYMDDRPGHEEIAAKMKNPASAHQIKNRLTVEETLALFPLLEIVFSNRRHSTMFGALHGIVGLGVGEEPHVKPPMEQLGIGADKFVSMEEYDYELMRDNLIAIWEEKDEITERIKVAYPELRRKALGNARLAAKLITD